MTGTPPPASQQGWDRAEFTCGCCGVTVTAATEREYIRLVAGAGQAATLIALHPHGRDNQPEPNGDQK
ncbi:hypothetical protein [Kitasatospora sp. NPDC091276]|uniref:hypothetical protein n=1 Tax=unclassified Kitasatospora TaxID=2633591 RepID=UPI00341D48D5